MEYQNNDELYQYFKRTIDAEVNQKVVALEKEIAILKDQAQASMEKELQENQKNLLHLYQSDLEKEHQLKLAAYQRKIDLAVIEKRQKLLDDIFAKLQEEIIAFVASPDYLPWLTKKMDKYDLHQYRKIIIAPHDKIILNLLKKSNLERVEQSDLIGGFIIFADDGKTLLDESLKNRLLEAHDYFYDHAQWFAEGDNK